VAEFCGGGDGDRVREFCGGQGSGRPGPCPKEGGRNAHLAARAHANAAQHALHLATAAHARRGNEKTAAALAHAHQRHETAHAAAHAAETQASARGTMVFHRAYVPLKKRTSKPKAPVRAAKTSPVSLHDPQALARAIGGVAGGMKDKYGNAFEGKSHEAHQIHVSDLYDRLKPQLGGANLSDFKAALLRGHQSRALSLSRNDLPQVNESWKKDAPSEIAHPAGAVP
jgi:hypothetical protein